MKKPTKHYSNTGFAFCSQRTTPGERQTSNVKQVTCRACLAALNQLIKAVGAK